MRNPLNTQPDSLKPLIYQIRIRGHLDSQWTDWFEGLTITLEENGDTLLSGAVVDQAALHGLLKKVRGLGMPLISVQQVQADEPHQDRSIRGIKMSTVTKIDPKVLLSTLWIAVMINMLAADILSLNIPGAAEEMVRTAASAGASIPQLMLLGAVMGQPGIAMIVLSRVLSYRVNRWANIIVSAVTIAYIWGGMASYPHYIFIAIAETLCLLLIIWAAWTWRSVEA